MKIVIQCAGSKFPDAPSFRTNNGQLVKFVAKPDMAPIEEGVSFAHPDDQSDNGQTWRQRLVVYNQDEKENPLKLKRAYQLYQPEIYRKLVNHFGISQIFILSAGWGLIPANFWIPTYDITFSAAANNLYRRRINDQYNDFCIIDNDNEEDIVFLGGKDYVQLFCNLTKELKGQKIILYRSNTCPNVAVGYKCIQFQTNVNTNWHYGCAKQLIAGELSIITTT